MTRPQRSPRLPRSPHAQAQPIGPRGLAWVGNVALCALLLAANASTARASSERRLTDQQISELEELATRGQDACAAKQYSTCHELFSQAQAMLPWPPHEYYLGEALVGQGRLISGVKVWREMLASNPAPSDPVVKDAVDLARQRLSDVEPTIPTLFFQVPSDHQGQVQIRLDGRVLTARQFNRELALDPGAHTFELSEPGHTSERHDVSLAGGVHQRVLVALERLPVAPKADPVGEPETHWSVPVGWSLAAGGAGAMIGSLALYLKKESLNRKLEQDCGDGSPCMSLSLTEFEQRSATIRNQSAWVNVLLFGGAGLATVGAGVLIWGVSSSAESGTSATLSVQGSVGYSGVSFDGHF